LGGWRLVVGDWGQSGAEQTVGIGGGGAEVLEIGKQGLLCFTGE